MRRSPASKRTTWEDRELASTEPSARSRRPLLEAHGGGSEKALEDLGHEPNITEQNGSDGGKYESIPPLAPLWAPATDEHVKESDSARLVAQILLCLEAVNNATAVHEPVEASLAAVVKSAEMQAHTAARWAGSTDATQQGKDAAIDAAVAAINADAAAQQASAEQKRATAAAAACRSILAQAHALAIRCSPEQMASALAPARERACVTAEELRREAEEFAQVSVQAQGVASRLAREVHEHAALAASKAAIAAESQRQLEVAKYAAEQARLTAEADLWDDDQLDDQRERAQRGARRGEQLQATTAPSRAQNRSGSHEAPRPGRGPGPRAAHSYRCTAPRLPLGGSSAVSQSSPVCATLPPTSQPTNHAFAYKYHGARDGASRPSARASLPSSRSMASSMAFSRLGRSERRRGAATYQLVPSLVGQEQVIGGKIILGCVMGHASVPCAPSVAEYVIIRKPASDSNS